MSETVLPDAVCRDLQLLVTVGTLWGSEAIERFEFGPQPETSDPSKLELLLHPFRRL